MRAVIQRVSEASVIIDNLERREIGRGLLVLLGIEESDDFGDIEWLSGKIARIRIFSDHQGLMNLSLQDIEGDVLLISQFTLHASTKKGNRPSFIRAAKPDKALTLYRQFIEQLKRDLGKPVMTGEFGADMRVNLTNEGPVTIWIDTKNKE